VNGIEDLLRDTAPQVLGTLIRRFGEFDACEDAVQDALLAAAVHWPREGVPQNPRGWLLQTAENRLRDHARSEHARRRREERVAREPPAPQASGRDDTLTLLFLCCHPALTPASAIALTLRAVGGLRTAEIARAYLVPEATMAQRISRAKQRIEAAGARFEMPAPGTQEWRARLASVLHVLYLLFNEGYSASAGPELHRTELSDEAIRLTRQMHDELRNASAGVPATERGEASGLLALMLLTDARRPARTGPTGELVSLADQDRSQWDRNLIAEGTVLLDQTMGSGRPGQYRLLAAIAALHDRPSRAEDTDWPHILAVYDLLERVAPSPVVTLNRAVALAMVDGPAAGLALLDTLDVAGGTLTGHHRLHAVRAHLCEMAGDVDSALTHYREAAALTTSTAEQRYLVERAARLRNRATTDHPDRSTR
jgi:RNA polymerase sigma factor (sigma-70 family)